MVFKIKSSPFTHNEVSTNKIMLWVIIALIPGIVAHSYFFGYGTLVQITLACFVALLAEGSVLALRKKPLIKTLQDNSALVTAILLAISIPGYSPWWLIVIGTFFAIIVAKQLYGGLGQNPFNPAMVGYVVLLISFPVQMTNWPLSASLASAVPDFSDALTMIFTGQNQLGQSLDIAMMSVDGITQATPLDSFKTGLTQASANQVLNQSVFTQFYGNAWFWINVAFLAGGLLLLASRYIAWQLPVSFLLTLALLSTLNYFISPDSALPPMYQLFSGATMLGAFFIVTDPITASTTPKGRLIFGALVGFLVWIIRSYGSYPDAVAFSVLLANITVPLIDHYTQPRTYGH